MFNCDLERKVGPYWRLIIEYKAARAAHRLWREAGKPTSKRRDGEEKSKKADVKVKTDSDAVARLPDEGDCLMEARLDIAMLVDGLKDPRQRAVMRLSAVEGYNYPEIAAKLRISFEQVRYAVEQARKELTA
jgi:DNA-directed RNA polymerase specialized sigma24 family protein